uniref:Uncharacterized protein n=1 Tax=Burkholderia sp. (strain CCGE1003) TaxID=640512 RepID=E1TBZ7_BURSG
MQCKLIVLNGPRRVSTRALGTSLACLMRQAWCLPLVRRSFRREFSTGSLCSIVTPPRATPSVRVRVLDGLFPSSRLFCLQVRLIQSPAARTISIVRKLTTLPALAASSNMNLTSCQPNSESRRTSRCRRIHPMSELEHCIESVNDIEVGVGDVNHRQVAIEEALHIAPTFSSGSPRLPCSNLPSIFVDETHLLNRHNMCVTEITT